MFNPHPPLTGFPAVILVLLATVEFFRLARGRAGLDTTSDLLLLALVLITPLTFLSGYLGAAGADRTFSVPPAAIELHRSSGRLLVILLVPTAVSALLLRAAKKAGGTEPAGVRRLYLFLLILALASCLWTGYLGGELVFGHGAGVRAAPPP